MENIKSFDCTPSPTMNAVIANFSSGISTFKDSTLNLWTIPQAFLRALLDGQQMITWISVCFGSNEVGDECNG